MRGAMWRHKQLYGYVNQEEYTRPISRFECQISSDVSAIEFRTVEANAGRLSGSDVNPSLSPARQGRVYFRHQNQR